jgi:hypothetical protein
MNGCDKSLATYVILACIGIAELSNCFSSTISEAHQFGEDNKLGLGLNA